MCGVHNDRSFGSLHRFEIWVEGKGSGLIGRLGWRIDSSSAKLINGDFILASESATWTGRRMGGEVPKQHKSKAKGAAA